jgi:hypothetical protein
MSDFGPIQICGHCHKVCTIGEALFGGRRPRLRGYLDQTAWAASSAAVTCGF